MTAIEVAKIVKRDILSFVQGVIENLKARFPNTKLIQVTKIFEPKNIPSIDKDCATYGKMNCTFLLHTTVNLLITVHVDLNGLQRM